MKKLLVILLILINLHLLISEEALADNSYQIINSDKLFVSKSGENYLMNMDGNVHFFYGLIEFYCNKSVIIEANETAKLIGDVVVKKDSLTIYADYAFYDNINEVVHLNGSVRAIEHSLDNIKEREFQADSLVYFRKEEKIRATKNVVANEYSENIIAKAGFLEYRREDGYGFMKIDPYIENKQDSLTIKANKMEYFEDFDKIVATFSVETILKEASVFSDFLIYYNEEGRALFTGQPRLETDFGTGIAESFNLFFVEDEIDRVEFVNDCRLDFSFEEDGEEAQDNWLKADKINISFAEGDPSKIDAHDNISYLFITEEEKRRTKEYVANRSSSDFLELYIDEDLKIEQIQQEKNIRGTYIFKSAKRIIKK